MAIQRWALPRCQAHLNKVIYKNDVAAHQALINLPNNRYGGAMHFYQCPEVPAHWHIGHVSKEFSGVSN